ncbi:hypothetical protein DS031_15010 [Bacillus taeanensis]|uniref:Uncharacterized protein n=1 Tax=Bacillus taeanensis TaxID=273032 RepID=A0A366XSL0_9BACI|nr:hypothetical protein DS031_15010 [Bacillus taeanensis]
MGLRKHAEFEKQDDLLRMITKKKISIKKFVSLCSCCQKCIYAKNGVVSGTKLLNENYMCLSCANTLIHQKKMITEQRLSH